MFEAILVFNHGLVDADIDAFVTMAEKHHVDVGGGGNDWAASSDNAYNVINFLIEWNSTAPQTNGVASVEAIPEVILNGIG